MSELLASVLKVEPDWPRLASVAPERGQHLVRRCLRKDQNLRIHAIADARIEIDDIQTEPDGGRDAGPDLNRRELRSKPGRERLAWVSALAFVTVIAVGASVIAFRPAPAAPEMRVEITTPATTDPVSLAISPDGRTIAFVATDNNQSRLWLRSLDTASARSFAGTDGATLPFWSPDSRALGFFAAGKLKRIDLEGGAVWTLANASDARGAHGVGMA